MNVPLPPQLPRDPTLIVAAGKVSALLTVILTITWLATGKLLIFVPAIFALIFALAAGFRWIKWRADIDYFDWYHGPGNSGGPWYRGPDRSDRSPNAE